MSKMPIYIVKGWEQAAKPESIAKNSGIYLEELEEANYI